MNQKVTCRPRPVATPANKMLAPSKRSMTAGEIINILWFEHEDVFTLLSVSNDSIWKQKIHCNKLLFLSG